MCLHVDVMAISISAINAIKILQEKCSFMWLKIFAIAIVIRKIYLQRNEVTSRKLHAANAQRPHLSLYRYKHPCNDLI